MSVEFVKDISYEAFKTILMVSGPVLFISLLVGLLISFLQAITQIQEFTLTFVPKVIAVFLSIFLLLPWFARVLISFTIDIIEKIPLYVR
jgi:flagellar biosynthetic protein FliQ